MSTKKPTMKTKLGVIDVDEKLHMITFYTDEETARSLNEFGAVIFSTYENRYKLVVDGRYVFRDVLAYVKDIELGSWKEM